MICSEAGAHTGPNVARPGSTPLERAKAALSGKRVLVAGLARTGVSAARFLAGVGAHVVASDALPAERLAGVAALASLGVDVRAAGADVGTGFDIVVVSPGVPFDAPVLNAARATGAEVISEVELAYRFIDAPVFAVAGTNGKTTTTTLLGEVLKAAGRKVFVGGNIGTPAIEYVESGEAADFCVLEVSSFHLETTSSFNPKAGILLNITEDHLDRYRDFAHYAETKFRLFENQTGGDRAIVNAADPVIAARLKSWPGKGTVVPFTASGPLPAPFTEGLFLEGGDVVYSMGGVTERYPVAAFRLKGAHNVENIMAVIAAGRIAGVARETIMETLEAFEGLSHRMETVRVLDGVTYVDDSKGTNVGALMGALKGTPGPVVLIAGGRDKGGDYGVLTFLVREKVKLLVLMGEARARMRAALEGAAETVEASSMEDAVRLAHGAAAPGDTVLLCPACSSFDMFRDYKERGERFRAAVEALGR